MSPAIKPELLKSFLSRLLPILLLLLLLCAVLGLQFQNAAHETGLTEEAYVNLSVARTLVNDSHYGLGPEQDVPLLRDTLWRLAVWGVARWGGTVAGASLLLSALGAVCILLIVVRWAEQMARDFTFVVCTGLLAAVAPSLISDTIAGTSDVLAVALVTGACLIYIQETAYQSKPLPLTSALLLGMAAWIRIEFVLLWPILGVHALAFHSGHTRGTSGAGFERTAWLAVRWWLGFVLLIGAIGPMLIWNMSVLHVPWPRLPGTPMGGEQWSADPMAALAATGRLMAAGLPEAYARLGEIPFLRIPVARVATWVGLAVVAFGSVRDVHIRPFTLPLFILVLLPPFYVLVYPYVGWESLPLMLGTTGPMLVAVAVYGIWQLRPVQKRLAARFRVGHGPEYMYAVLPTGLFLVVLCFSAMDTATLLEKDATQVEHRVAIRSSLLAEMEAGRLASQVVVTDEAGWLTYNRAAKVIDLSGEFTPQVLACLTPSGILSEGQLQRLFRAEEPDTFVLWNAGYRTLDVGFDVEQVELPALRGGGSPRVLRVR